MKNTVVQIKTRLSPQEIAEKLKSVTVTDFSQLKDSPPALYYGDISSHSFNIKNVRYSPYSAAPFMEGTVEEDEGKSIVDVHMDIREHYVISRNMYYMTLLPIGAIVLLLSLLVLGGTDYQMHGILFSLSFMLCAVAVVELTKFSLLKMKQKEVQVLADQIKGELLLNPGTLYMRAEAVKKSRFRIFGMSRA